MNKLSKVLFLGLLLSSLSSFAQPMPQGAELSSICGAVISLGALDGTTRVISAPTDLTSGTTGGAARLELAAVQADAANFLAGDYKTDMLQAIIDRIRIEAEGRDLDLSDVRISLSILELSL